MHFKDMADYMRTMDLSPNQIVDEIANIGFDVSQLEYIRRLLQVKIDELHAYMVLLGLEGPGVEGLGS